jgi:hypothetical protein
VIDVLASCIMMHTRRTTVTASEDSLQTLEAEARRRDVSLATLMREAVDEKARAIRDRQRPRLGVARSTDGLSAANVASDPVANEPR